MKIDIKAPTLPESVPDGTVATWHKNIGEAVKRDELLVDIETDKVVIEVVFGVLVVAVVAVVGVIVVVVVAVLVVAAAVVCLVCCLFFFARSC